ncbi:MAG: hypothetical protein ACD_75C00682G0002 [uncultured bacterium]|nr:MAG: hypothetical protein ACD_75C00682G0002 [uncultured bacterium]
MIDIRTLADIASLSETVDLECKLAAGKDGKGQLPADFWPTYSAFANTHGGVILLGVKEKQGRFSLHGVINLGERAGSGLPKIRQGWETAGGTLHLFDSFEPYDQTRLEMFWGDMAVETGKMTGKVFDLLTSNPSLTIPELAAGLRKSESTIERAIRELRKVGRIQRVGSRKDGCWKLVDDVDQ